MRSDRGAGWRLAALAAVLGACASAAQAGPTRLSADTAAAIRAADGRPAVIAHRGASALRPEHTLAAYAKAIDDGADFVEPDLVMTRDGVLVARHENEIGETTDVAAHPAFAERRTVREVDGRPVEGWFVEDFTLAELRTLRARERLPDLRDTSHDGRYSVPTFEEIVDAVAGAARETGRTIGIVPEIKHSTHFHARGLDPEAALVAALQAHEYTRTAPVGVQSFEVGNLRRLRTRLDAEGLRNVFLVQLIGAPEASPFDLEQAGHPLPYLRMVATPQGLADIAAYADVLAPHLRYVLPLDDDGAPGAPSPLVGAAHAAGLAVHVWTLRPENAFLPPALRCGADDARCDAGADAEARAFAAAGVDALFGDDPGQLRQALDAR